MRADLKPCPYCGETLVSVKAESTYFPTLYSASACCAECEAAGPWTHRHATEESAMNAAISKWNTRQPMEARHG